MAKKNTGTSSDSHLFPPVVAVLGHVDHGKTSLLDAIRKTDIAQKEHGGITQSIGASKIEFLHDKAKRQITFIDTPGHVAFTKMRGRGTLASDIGLLVVSSTDGLMPQTKESISILNETKTPFIVVLAKSDLPDKNPEKVKGQLSKEGVVLEESGGDVPVIEVSAKNNTGIKELLELILLVFELKEDKISSVEHPFKAIIIESKLDSKKGPVATIVIKNGSLVPRDEIYSEDIVCRVKSITNDKREQVKIATPGDAVEVLGFVKVPSVGGLVLKSAKPTLNTKTVTNPALQTEQPITPENIFAKTEEKPTISVILCADTLGSLEAIVNALPKEITILSQKTGEISPSDISFAKSIGAIVLGFNIKINSDILRLATQEKVLVKNYNLIYELIDDLTEALKGKELEMEEKILGRAKVLASFPFEKTKVLGFKVLEGRVAKGDKITLVRNDESIGESRISSMRSGKNPISKAEVGEEAGAILSPFLDFTIGDMLICQA